MRLSKVLSTAAGVSRRVAQQAIERGHVNLNGKTCRLPATIVQQDDAVFLDGQPVAVRIIDETQLLAAARVWLYHKPPGLVVTHNDPERRPTVFEALSGRIPARHVMSVGRLDLESEGLLLMTDTGALARRLELPSSGFVREYDCALACSSWHVTPEMCAQLRAGLTLADGHSPRLRPIQAKVVQGKPSASDSCGGQETWVRMELTEGKNREIRRAWETLGLLVTKLARRRYGPFALGALGPDEVVEAPADDMEELRRALARSPPPGIDETPIVISETRTI